MRRRLVATRAGKAVVEVVLELVARRRPGRAASRRDPATLGRIDHLGAEVPQKLAHGVRANNGGHRRRSSVAVSVRLVQDAEPRAAQAVRRRAQAA